MVGTMMAPMAAASRDSAFLILNMATFYRRCPGTHGIFSGPRGISTDWNCEATLGVVRTRKTRIDLRLRAFVHSRTSPEGPPLAGSCPWEAGFQGDGTTVSRMRAHRMTEFDSTGTPSSSAPAPPMSFALDQTSAYFTEPPLPDIKATAK